MIKKMVLKIDQKQKLPPHEWLSAIVFSGGGN
jgi:hypothetical protein